MTPFRNILVYANTTTEIRPAVEQAARLAEAWGASLTLIDVIEHSEEPLPAMSAGALEAIRNALTQEVEQRLVQVAAPLREAGLAVEVRALWGKPFLELIRQVLRHGHDLVVKTAEGRKDVRQHLFGTTAMHLFRKCPCPVWVVQAGTGPLRQVAAALDLGPGPAADLNPALLALADDLATSADAELHLVHAWSVYGERLLSHRIAPDELSTFVEGTKAVRRGRLKALLTETSLRRAPHVHLQKGSVEDVVPQIVREHDIDLIVMGTLGRVGVPGLFIGNTAERLLDRLSCSVLAVKPVGFVSPVQLGADG